VNSLYEWNIDPSTVGRTGAMGDYKEVSPRNVHDPILDSKWTFIRGSDYSFRMKQNHEKQNKT
jgi:hypothetical protein